MGTLFTRASLEFDSCAIAILLIYIYMRKTERYARRLYILLGQYCCFPYWLLHERLCNVSFLDSACLVNFESFYKWFCMAGSCNLDTKHFTSTLYKFDISFVWHILWFVFWCEISFDISLDSKLKPYQIGVEKIGPFFDNVRNIAFACMHYM